ncbi:MAG TPA: hypothetical protein VMU67_00980 [Steroidobacteraceae bacterium]|nr:hypothetical protein [Steroidobacteraceae bacterium]
MTRSPARTLRALATLGAALALAACSHLPHVHWPWQARSPPTPEMSHDLVVTSLAGGQAAAYPQFWKRNTLVLDLRGISGSGGVALTPRAGASWPVRLALRVTPGSVGELDVKADERQVFPVVPQGTGPLDLELSPGLYSATTERITVNWAPAPAL